MNRKKLYIIGNGFDLHHGIKSSYYDFREYIKKKDPNLLDAVEKYLLFDDEALWSDFEEALADLDADEIIDECLDYYESYGHPDWNESMHHDYQFEVQRRIQLITVELKQKFTEWILQLNTTAESEDSMIAIDRTSYFLTFNYTNTLEHLYRVPHNKILYLHKKADNPESDLILGHSRKIDTDKTLSALYNSEETDPRLNEGNELLDEYFTDTYKPTQQIIEENKAFFCDLKEIEEINILGHSLSEVDMGYFWEIVNNINKEVVRWKISCYKQEYIVHYSEVMKLLGIPLDLVEFDSMHNFRGGQLKIFE